MSHAPKKSARTAGAIDTLVIGAGHSGLAASHELSTRDIDHVVLERGEVANAWRNERWDSLKLLTPNWQCQLPGYSYSGDDPDGFMGMPELIEFMQGYADSSGAPVRTHTTVESVRPEDGGYKVTTNKGEWFARSVVIASGAHNQASVPKVAKDVPAEITQLTTYDYKNVADLPDGGVLIVGGSATGLQLADEIRRSGREVTLATGEHVRMPRRYRGRDIFHWMHVTGLHDECYTNFDDVNRVRRLPSPQLVGNHDYEILDLNMLMDIGVKVVGRLMGVNNGTAQFSGSLRNVCALADLKLNRMLDAIDVFVEKTGTECGAPVRFDATRIDEAPQLGIDLSDGSISTIIWATGFRPDYSWLDVPVLDGKGHLRHDGGVLDAPGLYAMGLPMMRRRKSSFIFGAADDARDIVTHLAAFLGLEAFESADDHQRLTPVESLGYARA